MILYGCTVGLLSTNCYLIVNEITNETLIVDPGDGAEKIAGVCESKGLRPTAILLTHAHFDHIGAVGALKKRYGGIPVYIGEGDREMLESGEMNNPFGPSTGIVPDQTVREGEELKAAGMTIKVLHTPGHTAGSVCYYFEDEKVLVAGDTLFLGSHGRTDFPTGSEWQMEESLKRLLTGLPEDVNVLPGHGPATTIGNEKAVNGF